MHKITPILSTLVLILVISLGWKDKEHPVSVSGITESNLATHIYNDHGAGGYLTFGFNPTTGAGTATADPLTIQQSNMCMGIFVNNPQARLHIKSSGATNASSAMIINNSANTELLRVIDNGYVGIGTATPSSLLAVNGTITTKKVKLTPNGWSDYVFDKSYQLPSLQEVEAFITKNKHLPGIPSEAEVMKNGIELGDNQSQLLKKIEELTLYAIQQQKEINALKEMITKQTAKH